MTTRLFGMTLVLGCLFLSAGYVQAQCGGKAEPNRIAFKRGAHSSTVKGKLKGDEQAEYIFGAGEGQTLSIALGSVPADSVSIELQTSGGETVELKVNGTKWSGILPTSGDYLMFVKLAPGCTGRAAYTLTLSIK